MATNLYLLKTELGSYDAYDGFVIAAQTEKEARSIAQHNKADENCKWDKNTRSYIDLDTWIKPELSTCELLAKDSTVQTGLILGSFNAG